MELTTLQYFGRITGQRFDRHTFQYRKGNRKIFGIRHKDSLQCRIARYRENARIGLASVLPTSELIVQVGHGRY